MIRKLTSLHPNDSALVGKTCRQLCLEYLPVQQQQGLQHQEKTSGRRSSLMNGSKRVRGDQGLKEMPHGFIHAPRGVS